MVHWGVRPYLRPLAEAIDDFPYYGIVVADQRKVRLFTVSLREIEEAHAVPSRDQRSLVASF
jgi:hypothetical protein